MNRKLALVTGAYRGLGLEAVRQLLIADYEVILTSRNPEKGRKAAESFDEYGKTLHYHELDITNDRSVEKTSEYVTATFGRLDVLINNAGINYDTWHNAETADLKEVQQTLDTNLMGAWRMAQAFIPLMRTGGYGRIVNVSSGAGAIKGMSGGTPGYSISKAAMNVLTIKLAADLHDTDILVNAVCPGWVRTEMGGSAAPRSVKEGASGIVWLAWLPSGGPSGKFFRDKKEIPW